MGASPFAAVAQARTESCAFSRGASRRRPIITQRIHAAGDTSVASILATYLGKQRRTTSPINFFMEHASAERNVREPN